MKCWYYYFLFFLFNLLSVDADGLATFVYEHSYIENKPAIKQYELCYKAEDLEEIEKHPDHVTSLRLSGEYFREEMITMLDFASYGFSSLEYLYLAFSVCFWTDIVKMSSEWVSEWVSECECVEVIAGDGNDG